METTLYVPPTLHVPVTPKEPSHVSLAYLSPAAVLVPNIPNEPTNPASNPPLAEKSLPFAIGLNLILPGVGYMYMGNIFAGIVAFLAILAFYASTPFLWFLVVWISLNAIMALDVLMLSNKRKKQIEAATTRQCPQCAKIIKAQATVCRFCGARL